MVVKFLPFKRVVGVFFVATITIGSVLFIRAYIQIRPSTEKPEGFSAKDALDNFSKAEELHLGKFPQITSEPDKPTILTKTTLRDNASDVQTTREGTVVMGVYSSHEQTKPTTAPVQAASTPSIQSPPPLDPKFRDYGEKNCKGNSLRRLFIELVSEWIKLASQESITYFLYSGSLLGQARDEDIIPYDTDVDIVVEIKDFVKLQSRAQPRDFSPSDGKFHLVVQPEYLEKSDMDERNRYSCQGKLVPHLMDSCSFVEPMGRLIKNSHYIDIFLFIDKGESIEIPNDYKLFKHVRDEVYPIQKCRFLGIENVHCPRNTVALLKSYFGDNLAPSQICKGRKWVKNPIF